MLQDEIDALHLPVRVAALVNDTVGTLMARSYTSPGKTGTLLGAIFGTGTNGAYVEKLSKVKKLLESRGEVKLRSADPAAPVRGRHVDADLGCDVVGRPLLEVLEGEPSGDFSGFFGHPERTRLRVALEKPRPAALDGDGLEVGGNHASGDGLVVDPDDGRKVGPGCVPYPHGAILPESTGH